MFGRFTTPRALNRNVSLQRQRRLGTVVEEARLPEVFSGFDVRDRNSRWCPFKGYGQGAFVLNSRLTIGAAIYGTAIFVACLGCGSLQAQQDETYRIRVPGLVSINASNHFEQIIHDETDANQRFDWQHWQVVCNNPVGAVLTFETDQAFTHTTNPSFKRDVRLRLRKNGAPRWTITQGQDQTDYAGGDEIAVVEAETNRASDGAFRLRVIFLEELFVNTLAGDYDLTVTGTIVPK